MKFFPSSDFLLVGVGGFFGAMARYAVYLAERSHNFTKFPYGTLIINLSGCILAGVVLAVIERGGVYSKHLLLLCSIGFLGSFTTFSAFSAETLQLLRTNEVALASLNISMNVALGLACVFLGRFIALKF